jgi:DNA-binding transcriptional LysR family regulator
MIFDKKFEVFLTVAELGSFSKAARRLSMTQSSVSFHVQSLEKALGVKLFERKGRTIALTPEGECLRDEGETLMKRARDLEHTLSDLSSTVASNIRLAGDAMMCAFTFPYVLRDFKQEKPAVELSYQHLERDEIVEKLLSNELDLALIGYPFRHRKLESQMCFSSPITLVAGGAATVLPQCIEDVRSVPLLWSTADKGLELLLTRRLTEAGLPPRDLNIVMDVEDLNLIKTAAQAEIGMVFLPELTVANELESGGLQAVPLEDFELNQTTFMFARKENHREIVREFWSYIAERRAQAEGDVASLVGADTV